MNSQAAAHAARPAAAAPRARRFDETHTDLLRLDLRDVPYTPQGLDVDALKPSLFSRFIGIFVR
jgi:hypothetical protein